MDEILNLIESVSEGFPFYFYTLKMVQEYWENYDFSFHCLLILQGTSHLGVA